MIAPTFVSTSTLAASRARRRVRGIAWVALLTSSALIQGCGVSVVWQKPDLVAHPKQRAEAKPDQIRDALDQSALAPKEPYWPYRLGQLYLAADSLAKAEAALKAALERDPCHAPALALLSNLYFDAGRHQEAVQMLEAARSRKERFPDGVPPALLAGLALHYDALDRVDLAHEVMATLARSDRNSTGSAAVYLTLRGTTPDSAAELAEAAVRRNPMSAACQNNFGITRLRAGDPTSARRAFMDAIALDPRLPGPYHNLAILEKFYLLDDVAAARWFKLYRERSTDDPDGLAGVFGKSEPGPVVDERSER